MSAVFSWGINNVMKIAGRSVSEVSQLAKLIFKLSELEVINLPRINIPVSCAPTRNMRNTASAPRGVHKLEREMIQRFINMNMI